MNPHWARSSGSHPVPFNQSSKINRQRHAFQMDPSAGLFASPSYLAQAGEPEHPRELRRLRFVGAKEAEVITLCRPHAIGDFRTARRTRLATHDETKAAVLAGRGIGALPLALVVVDELDAGKLVRVLPEWDLIDRQAIAAKAFAAAPESLRMFSL